MSDSPKRSRGRPVGGRAFERSDVIDVALQAIAKGGYAGLSMRGVARDLGASLATVQRYFATKDALWRGAVDAYLDSYEPPDMLALANSLELGIGQMFERGREYPGLITALLADRGAGSEDRLGHFAERLTRRHEVSLAIIAEQQEVGRVRSVDAHALLLLVVVGIGAVANSAAVARDVFGFDLDDPEGRQHLVGALADILRLGVEAR